VVEPTKGAFDFEIEADVFMRDGKPRRKESQSLMERLRNHFLIQLRKPQCAEGIIARKEFVAAITASGGAPTYSASGLPTGLTINSTTGAITGTPAFPGNYSVAISATTANGSATRACRAAIDLAARIDELNKECDARWQRRLDVRMGLDSGEIVAGLFGGNRLANYSVAGPAVDFARRLCSASSSYGARILIGPDAYSPAAESLEVRPIEILKVSARRRRVEIYEILTAKHGLSPERERSRDHFWTGVLHYREKQWEKAVDEFTKARITGLPDPALDFYLRRIEQSRRLAEDSHKESMPAFQHNA
jgi:class 3 adenylate cyclase